ncbi:hypothetical protein [Polaromonas jejuensis]|uniref:Uncharacterized protein n=1 Tax=Polaromonas jejuensis TaxID=457502 RepID=A0ABW0QAK9_9BURK|nr:hypothetical protein [Polaromonas jejuensis]
MRVDNQILDRWQKLDASNVLLAVADYAKEDVSFVPAKKAATTRWHARVRQTEFELLLTGPKFWDVRANRGGGGAVDLVMHLHGCNFKPAAALLKESGL